MKSGKNWLGILTLILIFGLSGTAYAQSGAGTFTLTGIPARFNGMYVLLWAENRNVELIGAQNYNLDRDTGTLPRIQNGRVSIPMWIMIDDGRTERLVRYNGNHTVEVEIEIYKSSRFNDYSEDIAYIYFERISFSNGSAAASFQDNDEFDVY